MSTRYNEQKLTFRGSEVLAGCCEASCPVHVHSCHTELVPPACSDVRQSNPLIRSLGGKCHVYFLCSDMATCAIISHARPVSQTEGQRLHFFNTHGVVRTYATTSPDSEHHSTLQTIYSCEQNNITTQFYSALQVSSGKSNL